MSMFESRSVSQYVTTMLCFLKMSRQEFGWVRATGGGKPSGGRFPRPDASAVRLVEDEVNRKAARSEANDTNFGERYRLARDYCLMKNSEVARRLGVSRELVRSWAQRIAPPGQQRLEELARVLQVPDSWLLSGSLCDVAADSTLGVRVGHEAMGWREQLYIMTCLLLHRFPDVCHGEGMAAVIDEALVSDFSMRHAARRAGGRWQVVNGQLVFAPWVPLPLEDLRLRHWSDETEEIIREELFRQPTTYAAWDGVKRRCEALGLAFPTRVALHKRVAKSSQHIERFGIVLES